MPEEAMPTPHKRRVRYSGTHPTRYDQKYKELQPDKYRETIEKVIRKGGTPAGMHRSVMVQEALKALDIRPGEQGLDCTLGYGGHTQAMLGALGNDAKGHLYALDIDPIESEKTEARLRAAGYGADQLTILHRNFAQLADIAKETGRFDFIMADLGVSSMQIDDPARGFSFKADGPLDLRMNPTAGQSAAERLQELSRDELIGCFEDNADEPYAEEIAAELTRRKRKGEQIETTTALRETIAAALLRVKEIKSLSDDERQEAVRKSCARVFQALRIDVNHEYESLYALLEALPGALKPGGRVVILTFHSGEDRLVKRAFKDGIKAGVYTEISDPPLRPSPEECFQNSRARSTKLRFALRSKLDTDQTSGLIK